MLAELWTAAGKALEADRLQVYRQSLGEVPLGLLELAVRRVIRENVYHGVPLPGVVWAASSATRPTGIPFGYDVFRNVAETAAPRGCSANGGLSHGDALRVRCASLTPPRLVAAGVGGSVGCEAGVGGLDGEEMGEGI